MTALLKEREFHIGRFFCVLLLSFTMRGGVRAALRFSDDEAENEGDAVAGQGKASTIDKTKGSIGRQKKVPSRG